jgi:hypothetical protein
VDSTQISLHKAKEGPLECRNKGSVVKKEEMFFNS